MAMAASHLRIIMAFFLSATNGEKVGGHLLDARGAQMNGPTLPRSTCCEVTVPLINIGERISLSALITKPRDNALILLMKPRPLWQQLRVEVLDAVVQDGGRPEEEEGGGDAGHEDVRPTPSPVCRLVCAGRPTQMERRKCISTK